MTKEELAQRLALAKFSRDEAVAESSLKYAYVWYQTAVELSLRRKAAGSCSPGRRWAGPRRPGRRNSGPRRFPSKTTCWTSLPAFGRRVCPSGGLGFARRLRSSPDRPRKTGGDAPVKVMVKEESLPVDGPTTSSPATSSKAILRTSGQG